jgi:DNA replication ATP-dependent helicase Dna2
MVMDNEEEKTIRSYYTELKELVGDKAVELKGRYKVLYRIFNDILNRETADCPYSFAGPFPRLNYVVRENEITHEQFSLLNNLRLHCRSFEEYSPKELTGMFLYDTKVLTDFIERIYHLPVPSDLKSILPITNPKIIEPKGKSPYLRISVERWDETYIYGTSSSSDSETVKVNYVDGPHGDRSYLPSLLQPNTQLNLINSVFAAGIYTPELIILEPDYLVDVTGVARCFTNYGNTAHNYLLNKIKPDVTSAAILLGNLASQFLDELINDRSKSGVHYADSVKKFFAQCSLDIATCLDMDDSFHLNAQSQLNNLENIIQTQFTMLPDIKMDRIILEPSFFCEMLGLQGRMDLLQEDMKILMEQKSGKREYMTNRHKEDHYVQMLLYLAVVHYNFKLSNINVACFLLYSKYADGLMKEGPAPKLLFEAMKIRNQIVRGEFLYADGHVSKFFEALTPERINVKNDHSRLWELQYPRIREQLNTIQHAPADEKAYFYRFFTFVAREQMLSKIGTPLKEGSGFSSLWNATLDEKKQTGDIYDGLSITGKEESGNAGFNIITLSIPEQEENFLSNFRTGDNVILYSYLADSEPDVRQTMVLRGSVKEIRDDTIIIFLRHPQRNAIVFEKDDRYRWTIEHDSSDSSSGQYRALYDFLKANKERRDLLMNRTRPRTDSSITVHGSYGTFDECVRKAKQARDYFLLIGPPGTGKTSHGLVNILQEELSDADTSVLLSAYTNRAVDEICSKLKENSIPFVRIGNELVCDRDYSSNLLSNKVKSLANKKAIQDFISNTRVIVGTISSLTAHINLFSMKRFSLAIIDEASQILEPQMLPLFCARNGEANAIDRFVFIGDYKQLPAVVQQSEKDSAVSESVLRHIALDNCRNSLFERLIRLQHDNPDVTYMLTRQGRMHPLISEFPNQMFYGGELQPVPLPHQQGQLSYPHYDAGNAIEKMLTTHRLLFLSSEGYKTLAVKVNENEARIIAATIHSLYELYKKNDKTFDAHQTVGVIVPYRNQIAMVRKALESYAVDAFHDITIDTVERFQGSERDVIIYGFTVHRNYQLDFLTSNVFMEGDTLIDRRLNVVLTRAREQMIITGNEEVLRDNILFAKLIDFIKEKGGYYRVSTDKFCEGSF